MCCGGFGAQLPEINANLVHNQNPQMMSKIKLQPFCGDVIDADWIRLKIQVKAEPGATKVHTIDRAMVPKLNEQFNITADVMAQLARDTSDAMIASKVVLNDDGDDINLNDDIDAVVNEDTDDSEPHNSLDESEASCQKVAQEQREDETVKGYFKLAREVKGHL